MYDSSLRKQESSQNPDNTERITTVIPAQAGIRSRHGNFGLLPVLGERLEV